MLSSFTGFSALNFYVFSVHISFIFAVTLLHPGHSAHLDVFPYVSNTEPYVNDDTYFPFLFLQLLYDTEKTMQNTLGVPRHLSKWVYDAFYTKSKAEFLSDSCLP